MTEKAKPKRKATRRGRTNGRTYYLNRIIYGRADGEFLQVEYDPESTPPERIGDLEQIGNLSDLIRGAIRHRNQMAVADEVGISRATFNNYAYQGMNVRPSLQVHSWRTLVRLYFDPASPTEKQEKRRW